MAHAAWPLKYLPRFQDVGPFIRRTSIHMLPYFVDIITHTHTTIDQTLQSYLPNLVTCMVITTKWLTDQQLLIHVEVFVDPVTDNRQKRYAIFTPYVTCIYNSVKVVDWKSRVGYQDKISMFMVSQAVMQRIRLFHYLICKYPCNPLAHASEPRTQSAVVLLLTFRIIVLQLSSCTEVNTSLDW